MSVRVDKISETPFCLSDKRNDFMTNKKEKYNEQTKL